MVLLPAIMRGIKIAVLVVAAALGAACSSDPGSDDESSDQDLTGPEGRIADSRVSSVAQIPHDPPARGRYRVHMIDVGTGLAILVQGHDFNMLFDAGSGDALA